MVYSSTVYYAFKQFSRNVPIMLKKVPIMPVSFSTNCPFLTITNTYTTGLAAILRFCAKLEGLGDFSQLNNETTRASTSWPGSWESSRLAIAAVARTYSRRLNLTTTTRALFLQNCLIILKLCFMLLRTDYSGNYAGILDAFLD